MAVAGSLLLVGAVSPVAAFCEDATSPWVNGHQRLYIKAGIPAGWFNAISLSVAAWNGVDPDLNYLTPVNGGSSSTEFNLRIVDFSSVGWDNNSPARTINTSNANPHVVSNVYVNSTWSWNLNGTLNKANHVADVRTVLTHEFGHSAGLLHPDCDGLVTQTEAQSVMHSNYVKKWAINSDDRLAVTDLY